MFFGSAETIACRLADTEVQLRSKEPADEQKVAPPTLRVCLHLAAAILRQPLLRLAQDDGIE